MTDNLLAAALRGVKHTKQFQTAPDTEMMGAFFMGWMTNQLQHLTQPKLEARGLAAIDSSAWYPYQTLLDLSREIVEENTHVTETLVSVGKSSAEPLDLPDYDTMGDFRGFLEGIHGQATRNHPENEKVLLVEHGGQYFIINNTPNSNDLFFGWCWEVLRKVSIAGQKYNLIPYADYPSSEVGSIFLMEPLD